jgi:hypothetical protein
MSLYVGNGVIHNDLYNRCIDEVSKHLFYVFLFELFLAIVLLIAAFSIWNRWDTYFNIDNFWRYFRLIGWWVRLLILLSVLFGINLQYYHDLLDCAVG